MKTTKHYKGHRWTNGEIKKLMLMWAADASMKEITDALNVTHWMPLPKEPKLN